jgi:uracil-DNA glycosylase
MKLVCNKCREHGLGFYAEHIQPHEYIEGNPNADIWIIGLNPKNEIGTVEARTLKQFQDFDPDCHPYFSDFAKVSGKLYLNWQSENSNIAHTDLVKCFSNSFPPAHNANRKGKKIIVDHVVNNCSEHLQNQIRIGKPKLLICNGSMVCREIMRLFPPQMENYDPKTLTSYQVSQNIGFDHHFWIVLSGFIGRIDDRNKMRLGKEIEGILEREGIELK